MVCNSFNNYYRYDIDVKIALVDSVRAFFSGYIIYMSKYDVGCSPDNVQTI